MNKKNFIKSLSVIFTIIFIIIIIKILPIENNKQHYNIANVVNELNLCLNSNIDAVVEESINEFYEMSLNNDLSISTEILNKFFDIKSIINATTQTVNFYQDSLLLQRAGGLLLSEKNYNLGGKYMYKSYLLDTNKVKNLYTAILCTSNSTAWYVKAINELESIIGWTPQVAYIKAVKAFNEKNYQEVVTLCRRARKDFGINLKFDYIKLFSLLYLSDNSSEIRKIADRLYKLAPDNIDYLTIASRGYYKIQDYNKAYDGFNKTIILGKTNLNAYAITAAAAFRSKKYLEALRYFKYIVKQKPMEAENYENIITCLIKLKYADAAMYSAWELSKIDFEKGTNYMYKIEKLFKNM